mmetsp:Transcript_149499/g.363107  ORF Transcript_149499/g.363107 Transcript_149499/m.363107 type:complete len:238 (-) Transcript_149499:71-784(-)
MHGPSGCHGPTPPGGQPPHSVVHHLLPLAQRRHGAVVVRLRVGPVPLHVAHADVRNLLEELARLLEFRRVPLPREVLHVLAHRVELQGQDGLHLLARLGAQQRGDLLEAREGVVQLLLLPGDDVRVALRVDGVLGVAELRVRRDGVVVVGLVGIGEAVAKAEEGELGGDRLCGLGARRRSRQEGCRQACGSLTALRRHERGVRGVRQQLLQQAAQAERREAGREQGGAAGSHGVPGR